ncbi:unnamed protein product, partial [Rotaria magnacalcarata]
MNQQIATPTALESTPL